MSDYFLFRKVFKLKKGLSVIPLAFSLFMSVTHANAQNKFNRYIPYSVVGFGVGTSSYYGDMAPIGTPLRSTFKPLRWSVTGNYTRHFTPRLAGRASFTWARIMGDDNLMYSPDFKPNVLYNRNLHFRNDLKEFALIGIFKLIPDTRSNDRRPQFGAYLFGGVAAVAHSPMARDTMAGEGAWRKLRPMKLEGKEYSLVTLAIPVGLGLRYKINSKWDISAELGFRFTRSDYLDDVSGDYADPSTLGSNAYMANRVAERYGSRKGEDRLPGLEQTFPDITEDRLKYLNDNYGYGKGNYRRGNTPGRADHYMLGMIHLNYILGSPIKCPPLK